MDLYKSIVEQKLVDLKCIGVEREKSNTNPLNDVFSDDLMKNR